MSESVPPVAIRVARPYATEDELLENELETLTRTSITLLGAPARPSGLVLRFELVLSSGQVLLRGEGRVVGYKPDAYYGTGGLTLRFTRLDSKSKAIVDRAAGLRDRHRPSAAPFGGESVPPIPSLSPGPIEDAPLATGSSPEIEPTSVPESAPPEAMAPDRAAPVVQGGTPPLPSPVPRDRDALLDRLRARSKALAGASLQKILERGR